ncbi:MAG: ATP-grasp domain-containing protein [Planctomycetales bacterium]
MRIFISEYVCGGGCPELTASDSLVLEGRAMLEAIVVDFAGCPGIRVMTTWDARLGSAPLDQAHTLLVDSPDDELPMFCELATLCDATLVIAPETSGLLAERCRMIESLGGVLLGPASRGVELCTDKLRLGTTLLALGIPTVHTGGCRFGTGGEVSVSSPEEFSNESAMVFPCVIKPRDGAGSQSTFLVRDGDELARLRPVFEADPRLRDGVWQPYVAGRAVSVAVVLSEAGCLVEAFPPAEQTLSDDGRFRYLGGVIPARGVNREAIQSAALRACEAVPGLRGYVGVDLIVPDSAPDQPLVVEINPRLTTSYIGYRQMTSANLARLMLPRSEFRSPTAWHSGSVVFGLESS